MDHLEEPFRVEGSGASAGVNPFFGEWRKSFKFPPVAYTAKSEKRAEFRKRVRAEIGVEYYFIDEVKVDITLHIDEQRFRETDKTADVDNFAKCILDCLKGKDGILIDDCQIQSLHISWIDVHDEHEWFEVEIKSHPDEFMLKDVKLYEMPNGLWYPLSNRSWDHGAAMPVNDATIIAGPLILEAMTDFSHKIRAKLRRHGRNRMQAYRESKYHDTLARGFHKSRVEGEFELVSLGEWRSAVEDLARAGDESSQRIFEYLKDFKSKKQESLQDWESTFRK